MPSCPVSFRPVQLGVCDPVSHLCRLYVHVSIVLLLLFSRLILLYCSCVSPVRSNSYHWLLSSRIQAMRTIYSPRPRLKSSLSSEAWRVGLPRGRRHHGEELIATLITGYCPLLSLLSYRPSLVRILQQVCTIISRVRDFFVNAVI